MTRSTDVQKVEGAVEAVQAVVPVLAKYWHYVLVLLSILGIGGGGYAFYDKTNGSSEPLLLALLDKQDTLALRLAQVQNNIDQLRRSDSTTAMIIHDMKLMDSVEKATLRQLHKDVRSMNSYYSWSAK